MGHLWPTPKIFMGHWAILGANGPRFGQKKTLAQTFLQIFIFIENDIIQLSTCFYEDYDESIIHRLLEFINGINYHCSDSYWILYSAQGKVEYRTVRVITENPFSKDIFKDVLKEFLENGPYDYDYIRRIMQSNEDDLDTLLNEWLDPISIDEMRDFINLE